MGLVDAFATTLKHFFKKNENANYPVKKLEMPERFRGVLSLTGMVGENNDQPPPDKMAPCTEGCPAHVNARGYINLTALGRYHEAYLLHIESNPMPATFGRICSHPCETECRRGEEDDPLSIRSIKRFMADKAIEQFLSGEFPNPHKPPENSNNVKVAIVGSGPAGLSCAYYLARRGYSPVIFEKDQEAGGMLAHGIPVHRLPRSVLHQEIELIKANGVEIRTGIGMGEDVNFKDLIEQGFKAFFVSAGLSSSKRLPIEGKELEGIYSATEVLRRINEGEKLELGENLIVIGAGNVAMDVTQCLCRLGKNVSVACRSTRDKLSAFPEEIEDAELVGAEFNYKIEPQRYVGAGGKVTGVEFKPVVRPGSETPPVAEGLSHISCDGVIVAIGQFAEIGFLAEAGVQFSDRGLVLADHVTCQTSIPNIFAGGDVVSGPSSAISGIGQGHAAALSIDAFLREADMPTKEFEPLNEVRTKHRFNWQKRNDAVEIDVSLRSRTFTEVEKGFKEAVAITESERCLSCSSKKCIGCQICENLCPDKCIHVAVRQPEYQVVSGELIDRKIEKFDIEISACSFCGICSEACPTGCLRHTTKYGFSTANKPDLIFNKDRLLEMGQ